MTVMQIHMKPLRDFRGRHGEGKDRMVEAGVEIVVADERRAHELEVRGLAVPVSRVKSEATEISPLAEVKNEAAATGPLGSRGGSIGAMPDALLSSHPDQVHPPRPSRRRRGRQG